jgi:hypothetical protein
VRSAALKKSAVGDDGTILCCSCIPKTSVQLEALNGLLEAESVNTQLLRFSRSFMTLMASPSCIVRPAMVTTPGWASRQRAAFSPGSTTSRLTSSAVSLRLTQAASPVAGDHDSCVMR